MNKEISRTRLRIILTVACVSLYLTAYLQELVFEQSRGLSNRVAVSDVVPNVAGDTPEYSEQFVNEETPGKISHVSSIAPLGGGDMAAVWYSGSQDSAPDVAIYYAECRRTTGPPGREYTWGKPRVLIDREICSKELSRFVRKVANPVLVRDGKKRLWLFYASVLVGGWSGTSLNYKLSLDNGKSWGNSQKMILSPFFNLTHNVKNKALFLDDGSFLLPVYQEFIRRVSFLLHFAPDGGRPSYELIKMQTEGSAIQPSLIREGPRQVLALFRGGDNGQVMMSRSADLGRTSLDFSSAPIPNPDSGLDAINAGDGVLLAVLNNKSFGRGTLSLMASTDGGGSWRAIKVLEHREINLADLFQYREYSYPSINRSDDGRFHITYTYERRRIKHVVFNRAWLQEALRGGA